MIYALILAASTASLPDNVWAMGQATKSCATAFRSENYQGTAQWVAGYLTGLNSGWGGTVGHTTDLYGVMGEVKLICEAEPSTTLITATARVYLKLKKQSR